MSLNENGLSPADVVALNGNGRNDGMFGGDGAWWLIVLFLFIFAGWGNNGGLGNGGGGASENYVLASDFATIQRQLSDGFNAQERRTDAIINGICDLGYTQQSLANATNVNVLQGFNATQAQLASCCCDIREGISNVNYNNAMNNAAMQRQVADSACTIERQLERGFADTNYNMATQNCATLQAIDKVGDRVIDYLANKENQNLRDENFALRLAASQERQNNYLVSQLGDKCPIPAYLTCNPNAPLNYSVNYGNGCGCA